jgi:Tfp pilus assembly protein PilN
MRPVDLIPPEERRGARQAARTGPLAYLLVGVLIAALVAVTALVLTGNAISDRKAEVAGLEQEQSALAAEAEKLEPFTAFRTMEEARTATVTGLAKSRFDWERVLRELSLVLPEDVWLINLTGTVKPEVEIEDGAEITARDSVPGPALEIIGCAASQDSVGRFVAALHDIDGVTRVTAARSERPDLSSTEATGATDAAGATDESEDDCRTRDFIARFEVVAAFDEVQLDPSTLPPVGPPAAPSSSETPTPAPGGVR